MAQLSNLQLFSTEHYGPDHVNLLEESVAQRTQQLEIHDGRGAIVDRDLVPLNRKDVEDIMLAPYLNELALPERFQQYFTEEEMDKMLKAVKETDGPVYYTDIDGLPELTSDQLVKIQELNHPALYTVQRSMQLDVPTLASHLVGIVSENREAFEEKYPELTDVDTDTPIGGIGLEKTMDPFLLSKGSERLLFHVDGNGDPLLGLDIFYRGDPDEYYPLKLKTTIDSTYQQKAEALLQEYGIDKGGVVLLDVRTREVLAMASLPALERTNLSETATNHILTRNMPGSVFKVVVAAAALEHPKVNTRQSFNCNLNKDGESESSRPLGALTFEESFYQSCNYTFASLTKDMLAYSPTVLEDYADKLGLMNPPGWVGDVFKEQDVSQLSPNPAGTIWSEDDQENVGEAITQTAIGGKNVMFSPLSIANMMATIADGGTKKEVRVVTDLLYENNVSLFSFDEHEDKENKLSPYTVNQLQKLLMGVTEQGTAQALKGQSIAGKTGTANIRGSKEEESIDNHYWFAGYFPVEQPAYAMVVVDLNTNQNGGRHVALFGDFAQSIMAGP
ncbi:penicillin-binding transpeptidase domain-containing protein [Pontibacillus halophilus]|uniref:penicillin-binding transpeptidase domain-containing protein n=1 Tax=Pontibacillus halophilus TaxID=516704 RepID=UPI000ACFEBDE|nr:penicillin-binding transpeptidase domain-containing protein [Pontibacillus halophilus]